MTMITGALTVRRAKGNKDRRLFAGNGSANALGQWLHLRGMVPGPLFVAMSKRGRLLSRRLSDRAVTWTLRVRATQAWQLDVQPA
jgi:site-specific recombinase XerC